MARNQNALLDHHRQLIDNSAIWPEVASERGYRSAMSKAELRRLGFTDRQCRVPALLIPIWSVGGEIISYQIRPDGPRINERGKPVKYETPGGSRMVLDVPPRARAGLGDPSIPLFVTEGIRKADSAVSRGLCCIALPGVWNWRGSNEQGGKVALADWESVALNGRQVYIAFDSDVMLKPEVHQAMGRLKTFLESRGANMALVYLPAGDGGAKMGLDDYFAAGNTVEDLLRCARADLIPLDHSEDGETVGEYRAAPSGLVRVKRTPDGDVFEALASFDARIAAQVLEDDGVDASRLLEIRAVLRDRTRTFTIPSSQFAAMNWPLEHIGTDAIVYAGFGKKDHLRVAIQSLSGTVPERRVYTHTGWRQIDGQWVYLHAGGAVGAQGSTEGVDVRLPEVLSGFRLPIPPVADGLVLAIKCSLRLLEVAPAEVAVPLFCSIWAGAVIPADYSVQLTGPTGTGKTAIAALIQQHFGPDLDARHLPGSWSSTANALEGLAFAAKDAVLVVDDFAPGGSTTDIARGHRDADRLLRAQGNRSGRQRMRADSSLRAAKPPRGLILSTGEDVPRGESLRSRMVIVEVGPHDVSWDVLTDCQTDARSRPRGSSSSSVPP